LTHIIVVVDDDPRVRASLRSVLESAGYQPLMFPSAETVLASGALARAACLIADIRMPGMDGIELQRRVRLERPELPVIFITALDSDDIRRQAMAGGAVDVMVKPFDPGELLRTMSRLLNESPRERKQE
jgi:FixJ family two-component response regulator